jgi:hypothetical protein
MNDEEQAPAKRVGAPLGEHLLHLMQKLVVDSTLVIKVATRAPEHPYYAVLWGLGFLSVTENGADHTVFGVTDLLLRHVAATTPQQAVATLAPDLNEESDHFQKVVKPEWKRRAKACSTPDELAKFVRYLAEQRHDYGTIVWACVEAAQAAVRTLDRSSQGGLTGFQASCVAMQFIADMNGITSPFRLVDYGNMLFPQYDREFARTITASTWKWLQQEAGKMLAERNEDNSATRVRAHWVDIVNGKVPFGYEVVSD